MRDGTALYDLQLDADEIDFIRNLRDISLHFKAERAESRLRESRAALGFDQDRSLEQKFRNGVHRLLRETARAYFLGYIRISQLTNCADEAVS